MKYLTYLEKKRELEALQREVDLLERDSAVLQTQEFLDRLEELMGEYGVSPEGVRDILYPPRTPVRPLPPVSGPTAGSAPARKAPSIHAPRQPAVYRNPHTGEVLKTFDPRNAKLREWREKYGMNEVVNWKES